MCFKHGQITTNYSILGGHDFFNNSLSSDSLRVDRFYKVYY